MVDKVLFSLVIYYVDVVIMVNVVGGKVYEFEVKEVLVKFVVINIFGGMFYVLGYD